VFVFRASFIDFCYYFNSKGYISGTFSSSSSRTLYGVKAIELDGDMLFNDSRLGTGELGPTLLDYCIIFILEPIFASRYCISFIIISLTLNVVKGAVI